MMEMTSLTEKALIDELLKSPELKEAIEKISKSTPESGKTRAAARLLSQLQQFQNVPTEV